MKLLFVASECAPFVKTGGLADVIGALPGALAAEGCETRVMIPAYPALAEIAEGGETVKTETDLFGGPARLVAAQAKGLDLLLLDAPHLFRREGGLYAGPDGRDWGDNHLRFAALARAAAEVAQAGVGGWTPDLVNVHDWQAGLVPAYLRQSGRAAPPCVLTIHNIAFQGVFGGWALEALGLSRDLFTPEGLEYWGNVSFLKAGIAFSRKICTVSPTYARELMEPRFGLGLEGILQARRGDLSGVLNGVDLDAWNPETDKALEAQFTARTLKRRAKNRDALIARFDLNPDRKGPLFVVISRLTAQKGLDLLLEALPGLVGRGASLAVLGSGEPGLEAGFRAASRELSGAVGAVIGYDEGLSHLMQGGGDAILIPSRFEPCGLTQLYGLRYGCVPVVARTGGLADTVIDANPAALAADCATGVQFTQINAMGLDQTVARTCDLYAKPKVWAGMQRRGMRHPVGWETSAAAYAALFSDIAQGG